MTICHKPENTEKSHAAHPSLGKALKPAHPHHRAAVIAAISELTKAIGHAELTTGLYVDRDQRDNTHDAVTAIYDGCLTDAEGLIWSLGASFCQKPEHEALGCFAFAVSRMIFDLRTGY